MYRIALTKQFNTVEFGVPPNKLNFDKHFLVIMYFNSLRHAIKLQKRFTLQGVKTELELVEGYNIREYAFCTKKTFLIKLIQRKWKRLYFHWKRTLPRKLMYRQTGIPLPKILDFHLNK